MRTTPASSRPTTSSCHTPSGPTDDAAGTPVLVLVLAAFYVLSVIGIQLTAVQAGIFALAVFCSSHVGEIVRGALQAIPPGQTEAAHEVFSGIPDDRRKNHVQEGVGHYGVFSGSKFQASIYPVIRDFIQAADTEAMRVPVEA